MRAALRRGEPWHVVFRYDHPAGGSSWLELRFLPEPEAAPDGTRAWHGFAMDVTSQRATEDRLARLSRFHRTLSDTNEAIVRARDSASMLQTVTESVMSLGGLRGVAVFDAVGRRSRAQSHGGQRPSRASAGASQSSSPHDAGERPERGGHRVPRRPTGHPRPTT
ncbi:MAG: hypothetical protein U0235_29250 [Polyangiaceae bacterium]